MTIPQSESTSTNSMIRSLSLSRIPASASEEGQKKIWDRFFKSDSSRGKDKKGTGLGLSIVKEIIQAHEKTIELISTEGVGTEFIFRLPKGQAQ